MKVMINGIEIKNCAFCERVFTEAVCPCIYEKQNKEIDRLLNCYRKKNNALIFVMPNEVLG